MICVFANCCNVLAKYARCGDAVLAGRVWRPKVSPEQPKLIHSHERALTVLCYGMNGEMSRMMPYRWLEPCFATLTSERKFSDDLKAEIVNLNQELKENPEASEHEDSHNSRDEFRICLDQLVEKYKKLAENDDASVYEDLSSDEFENPDIYNMTPFEDLDEDDMSSDDEHLHRDSYDSRDEFRFRLNKLIKKYAKLLGEPDFSEDKDDMSSDDEHLHKGSPQDHSTGQSI